MRDAIARNMVSLPIWAHHAKRSRQILESGDIEEGLAAASAIGDDHLQKQAQGYVTPDSSPTAVQNSASPGLKPVSIKAHSKPVTLLPRGSAPVRLSNARRSMGSVETRSP